MNEKYHLRAIATIGIGILAGTVGCGDYAESGPTGPSAVGPAATPPASVAGNLGPQVSSGFVNEPNVPMAANVDISVFSPTVTTPSCGALMTLDINVVVPILFTWEDASITGIYWYIEDHHRNWSEGRSATITGLSITPTSVWAEDGARIEVTIVGETATATYPTGTGPGTKVVFEDATTAANVDVACQEAQGQSAMGPSHSFSEGSVNSVGSSGGSNDHVIYLNVGDPPITATFGNVPTSHDGSTFTFDLAFDPEPDISFRVLRFHAFEVEGGSIHRTKRKVRGSNETWTVHVTPSGTGDVTITLPETTDCDDDGAICTADGGMLNHSPTATVSGP